MTRRSPPTDPVMAQAKTGKEGIRCGDGSGWRSFEKLCIPSLACQCLMKRWPKGLAWGSQFLLSPRALGYRGWAVVAGGCIEAGSHRGSKKKRCMGLLAAEVCHCG